MTLADEVRALAFDLARSGRHTDCTTIEEELDGAGYPEVFVVLVDPAVRKNLNFLCHENRHPETD